MGHWPPANGARHHGRPAANANWESHGLGRYTVGGSISGPGLNGYGIASFICQSNAPDAAAHAVAGRHPLCCVQEQRAGQPPRKLSIALCIELGWQNVPQAPEGGSTATATEHAARPPPWQQTTGAHYVCGPVPAKSLPQMPRQTMLGGSIVPGPEGGVLRCRPRDGHGRHNPGR